MTIHNLPDSSAFSLDSARDILLQAATSEDNFRAKRSNYGLEVGVGVSVEAQHRGQVMLMPLKFYDIMH